MKFFDRLQQETQQERDFLLSSPIIHRCLAGEIAVQDYCDFLTEAYHHVKHTVPLLMAVGSRLTDQQEWLREAVAHYIDEEIGHQEWILNDIAASGNDKEAVRHSWPAAATELMVAYAYDTIQRVNPLGFFGMVQVLEGTSATLADRAASAISNTLNLPENALTYLRSHGSLDLQHIRFLEDLMNRIALPADQQQIIHSSKMFYRLYANIFRSLGTEQVLAA